MSQSTTITTEEKEINADYYEKGRQFEQYIIDLFQSHAFQLRKYRKSEDFNGIFLDDASNPDLEIELIFTGARKYRFAIECKWRKKFTDGGIYWADERKIARYESFQRQRGIPVFVAIGVGGEPFKPEKFFVTPLDNISRYIHVYESYMIRFERKPTSKFYYNPFQLKLF